MAVPVLLIAGFLGAGKTTLINRLLRDPAGRRIAAIVNDFGSIDIDAALLGTVSDDVVSLKNGCICCTLQGDLLRTLATVMRRTPAPEAIVIETSGVSDPAEIVRSLLDPVIFKAAALETVITLVDAAHITDRPAFFDDPLWQSQLRAADFIVLNKVDLVDAETLGHLRDRLAKWKSRKAIFETVQGEVPPDLLFAGSAHTPVLSRPASSAISAPRFETMSWTSKTPLSLARFQLVIAQISPMLLRAKGILTFAEKPGEPMLFQMVGTRATVSPSDIRPSDGFAVELVVIADSMASDMKDIAKHLESAKA